MDPLPLEGIVVVVVVVVVGGKDGVNVVVSVVVVVGGFVDVSGIPVKLVASSMVDIVVRFTKGSEVETVMTDELVAVVVVVVVAVELVVTVVSASGRE